MRLRWVLPILKYEAYGRFMKTIQNAVGFSASDVAQFRFRCLKILEHQGYKGVHLAFPTVSRRSVFRWQERYRASGKTLSSLLPSSTRPTTVRQMVIPATVLSFVKAMREQHPKLSKYKLKVFLDAFCDTQKIPPYSVSWIGKVIHRHAFFFAPRTPVKKMRKSSLQKIRIWRCPKQEEITLGYVQADGVKVVWMGQTLYFLCAIELKSRQAWARRVPSLSSKQATLFLQDILATVIYPIHTIQTDNGSEFHASFQQALEALHLTHVWSPPHAPKVNGYVERFNGIIQEEFIDYHVDIGVVNKPHFDVLLADWMTYYNTVRPHHGLSLGTPQHYLLDYQHQERGQSAICA